jgi:folylpolyglutamate synthase/dihydropteroate synthase
LVILDGAHDGLAASVLCRAVLDDRRIAGPIMLVVGCSTGHAPEEILEPLRALGDVKVVATAAQHPRASAPQSIESACRQVGLGEAVICEGVDEALRNATRWATDHRGAVVVTGSLFVVGEARASFVSMPRDPAWPRY